MHKQLRAALAVEVTVLVVALVFSIIYFVMGWYRTSRILDVMLLVLWVLVAAAFLLVLSSRSFTREEMVRRFYVSHDWIYNHEIGYAPLEQIVPDRDAYEFVTFAADALARMSYGFEVADPPQDFTPEYLISSTSFAYHMIGEEEDPNDKGVVIDRWRGKLKRVIEQADGTHEFEDVGSFSNVKELARLIDAVGAVSDPEDSLEGDVLDEIAGGLMIGGAS